MTTFTTYCTTAMRLQDRADNEHGLSKNLRSRFSAEANAGHRRCPHRENPGRVACDCPCHWSDEYLKQVRAYMELLEAAPALREPEPVIEVDLPDLAWPGITLAPETMVPQPDPEPDPATLAPRDRRPGGEKRKAAAQGSGRKGGLAAADRRRALRDLTDGEAALYRRLPKGMVAGWEVVDCGRLELLWFPPELTPEEVWAKSPNYQILNCWPLLKLRELGMSYVKGAGILYDDDSKNPEHLLERIRA